MAITNVNAVFSYGNAADLPATSGLISTVFFYAVDTNVFYVLEATTWNKVLSLQTAQANFMAQEWVGIR